MRLLPLGGIAVILGLILVCSPYLFENSFGTFYASTATGEMQNGTTFSSLDGNNSNSSYAYKSDRLDLANSLGIPATSPFGLIIGPLLIFAVGLIIAASVYIALKRTRVKTKVLKYY